MGGPGVADHAGGGGDGRPGAQHGRTRIRRRPGQHAGHALGVFVVAGTGHRPARGHVGSLKTQHVGVRQVQPDIDKDDAAAVGQRVHRFEPAKGDGQRGVHGGAGDRPGRHIDAAGDVDGDHRYGGGLNRGEHLRGRRSQRPRAGDADHPVDDEIGRRRDTLDEATPGFGERRQRLAMRAVRVEQHRVGGGAAASQERRRPQRVATVVAGSDDRAHPAADHPTRASGQLTADLGGQPEGRASHQRTVGQAGQQGRLSRADGVDRVVVAHLRPAVLGCRACAADF